MPNVDKGDAHVDNRWKKPKKKTFVQQMQNARLMPASLLNRIIREKSVSGYQNAELKRLTFLRRYLTDAMFSNASFVSLLRDIGREAQARVPSKLHQIREVCVWIPKCRTGAARVSKTLPHRRDDQ